MINIYECCSMTFSGRLTKDPVFGENKNGTEQAVFTIAKSKFIRGKDGAEGREITTFMPCYAFGEYLLSKLKKASKGDWILVKADVFPLGNKDNDLTSVGFAIESIGAIIPPKGSSGASDSENDKTVFVEDNVPF